MSEAPKRKVIALISGGIDSPLAALVFSKRAQIIPLHFSHFPLYCESSFILAVDIIKKLQKLAKFDKITVFPFGEILRSVVRVKEYRHYLCVVCRRTMLMIAEKLCEQENAIGIVTGEVLGQKASQTLDNFYAITKGVKVPIYRPLLGLDKSEIIEMAQKMGIWEEKHVGCCTATPTNPTTRAIPERIDEIVESLNLKQLINKLFSNLLILNDFEDRDLELRLLNYIYNL